MTGPSELEPHYQAPSFPLKQAGAGLERKARAIDYLIPGSGPAHPVYVELRRRRAVARWTHEPPLGPL